MIYQVKSSIPISLGDTHLVTERLSGMAEVHFDDGPSIHPNWISGANSELPDSAEHRTFTLTVRGREDLPAICQALQEIGCCAWVTQATEQGIETIPLSEYLDLQGRIEWR
ncbi:MAG TPA: hypothetical protein VF756_02855 [Thermoanaerobaculia bacterium]